MVTAEALGARAQEVRGSADLKALLAHLRERARPLLERMPGTRMAMATPVLRPLRSLVPPIRAGMMALDISPIIVFILIGVARRAIGCLGFGF